MPASIDFNDVAATVGMRNWSGGITVKNMAAGSKFTVQGSGKVTIDSSCDAGGTIVIYGIMTLTDSVVGGFAGTLSDDARIAAGLEVDATQLNSSAAAAVALALMYNAAVTSGTVSDAGAAAADFDTDLTEDSNDHYNNSAIVFTNGPLKGQVRPISDYDGGTKNITVDPAFTEAPANGDAFLILGRIDE